MMTLQKFSLALVSTIVPLALSAQGCKSRQFNDSAAKRIAIDNPDNRQCNDALDRDAPYDAKTLSKALAEGLNAASKAGWKEEDFKDLLIDSDALSASKGQLQPLYFDPCYTHAEINMSSRKPVVVQPLNAGGRMTFGGITLFKGHVFAEGFYRNRREGITSPSLFARSKYDVASLMTRQPFLAWDAKQKKFIPAMGKAPAVLADILMSQTGDPTLNLYRGTNVKYAQPKNALATLNNFPFGPFGSLFTTNRYDAALNWSNPIVLKSTLNKRAFFDAATKADPAFGGVPSVYLGIEFDYVEIAFLYKPGTQSNLFFDNLKGICVVKARDSHREAASVPECPQPR